MSYIPGTIDNAPDVTGTITTLGGSVTATVQGYSSCSVVLTGTWTATLIFETTSDGGATWCVGGFVVPPAVASLSPGLSIFVTANGTYQCIGMSATTGVRITAAALTSGPVNVRLVFSDAPPPMSTGFSAIQQNIAVSMYNNSTANLAAGAMFTGTAETTLGVAGIQVNIKADQPILMQFMSGDGSNWDTVETMTFFAGEGDARTFQSTASYFRVVAQNVGNATTTYFRLQTALCPVVEVLPKALTPHGRLRLAAMTTSWAPDPKSKQDLEQHRALLMDTDRNLNVRARCLTDEASFRDDFAGSTIYTDRTGTYYFTNGSTVVTGVGTLFTTELSTDQHIKISSHADSAYMVVREVGSDTYLELSEPYTGVTASGTGRSSFWMYTTTGAGTSITQTGSEIVLATGTVSGNASQAIRGGDYLPYVVGFKVKASQRIANQELHVGMADGIIGAVQSQALVVFDGTDNTKCKLRTSWGPTDVEETIVSLPDGATTATSIYCQLEVTANKVTLFINDVTRVEHRDHIPGPYASMDCHICVNNTGTAASSTTMSVDTYFLTNFDRVDIATSAKGDVLSVKELRSSSPTCTSVAAAVANTTLLNPTAGRLGGAVYNDSIATLYLKLGPGASTTSFTIALGRYDYYELPGNYVGRVNGYWSAATGSARVTEIL